MAKFPLSIKAVVIDLDGTLLDTVADLAHAANEMRIDLGMEALPIERIKTFIGKGLVNLVKRSLTDRLDVDPDPSLLAKAMPIYERHAGLFTRDVVDELRGQSSLGARNGLGWSTSPRTTRPRSTSSSTAASSRAPSSKGTAVA